MLPTLRLIRFSNAPTAVADILAGFLLTTSIGFGRWQNHLGVVAALAVASICLYSWGMVLNDLYDLPEDQQSKARRPLVTGELSVVQARAWAYRLLAVAVMAFLAACGLDYRLIPDQITAQAGIRYGAAAAVFLTLILCIWLYDGPLKRTPLAPWVMGSCRGLNLLLGATLPHAIVWTDVTSLPVDVWICVAAYATFVSGVTWMARREEQGGHRGLLILGATLMAVGYGILAVGPTLVHNQEVVRATEILGDQGKWATTWPIKVDLPIWPIAVLLLAFPVMRKAVSALIYPTPSQIKQAVISALGNLVFLDALICLYAAPQSWAAAVAVALLIIPITLLKRWIPPT